MFWVSISVVNVVLIPVCLYWLIRYIKISKTYQCCKARHPIIIDILIFIQTNIIFYWNVWKWMEYEFNLNEYVVCILLVQ